MRWMVALLLMCFGTVFSQTTRSDSLQALYGDSLLEVANRVFYSSPDSSFDLATKALNHATTHHLDLLKARALRAQAKTEVLRGEIEIALKRLKVAAAIFESNGALENVGKCYSLMSTAVDKINNTKESIEWLQKAVAIYRKVGYTPGLCLTNLNLSNSYAKLNDNSSALAALEEAKNYMDPKSNEWFFYYINAGIIYRNLKKYPLAKIQFDSSLAISRRNNMVDAEVTAVTDLASLYQTMNNHMAAILLFNKAVSMAKSNNLPLEESEALKGLTKSYEKMGDFKNAFNCQNRLKLISDSLFNLEKIKNINSVEARLKVSEKEKTIALQKLEMEKSIVQQTENRKQIQMLVLGTLLLGIVLFFTIFIYIKVRRQKQEVEIQKARAEKLNALNQKIFAVIAHDFKSPLITLNALIDIMDKEGLSREDLTSFSADVRHQITQSGQILENLLNWAKTELNLTRLNGELSDSHRVAAEVIKELGYVTERKNVSILNEIEPGAKLAFPPDILKIIFRNLLSNAVKFSHAGSQVVVGNQQHTFFVKDSGLGMDEKTMAQIFSGTVKSKMGTFNETGFGLGLHITNELLGKFKGRLWAEANEPKGTIFKFTVAGNG